MRRIAFGCGTDLRRILGMPQIGIYHGLQVRNAAFASVKDSFQGFMAFTRHWNCRVQDTRSLAELAKAHMDCYFAEPMESSNCCTIILGQGFGKWHAWLLR